MKYYACIYRYDWRGNYTPLIYKSEQAFNTPAEAFEHVKARMVSNRRWTIRDRIFGAVECEDGTLLPMRAKMDYREYELTEYKTTK